jgi:hypothetical protein
LGKLSLLEVYGGSFPGMDYGIRLFFKNQKYIEPISVEDCIGNPSNSIHNVSIPWKTIVLAFPLIGNWLVWKVGNGEKVRV